MLAQPQTVGTVTQTTRYTTQVAKKVFNHTGYPQDGNALTRRKAGELKELDTHACA